MEYLDGVMLLWMVIQCILAHLKEFFLMTSSVTAGLNYQTVFIAMAQ